MEEPLIVIVVILLFLLFSNNFTAFFQAIETLFVGFFPIFSEVGKMAVEEYIKSPYFITGAIMVVASAFGIWFGSKGGRKLLFVVSITCELASVASILNNLL